MCPSVPPLLPTIGTEARVQTAHQRRPCSVFERRSGTLGCVTIQKRFVDVAGFRGCYLQSGDGDGAHGTVLVVASMLVRAKSYLTTMRALASRGWRVIVLEMPGCGEAAKLRRAWSFEQYADWLARFIEAAGLERPVLVGHSNSGAVALIMGGRHADRVSRVVVVDTVGADVTRSLLRVLVGRAIDAVLETPLTVRAFHHVLYNLAFHTRNMLNQIRLAANSDVLEAAAQVRAPTLLAWGRHDHTMPPRCAELLRRQMPHAAMHISPTGSHDWIVDEPDCFADAITTWTRGADERA
jgi:pimeloyl-ACP methyl ester carboxylesterase